MFKSFAAYSIDFVRRGGFVVADVVDRAGVGPRDRGFEDGAMSSTWMREKIWPGLTMRRAVPSRSVSSWLRPGP